MRLVTICTNFCSSECTCSAALFLTGLRCHGVIFTQTFGLRISIEIECELEWNRFVVSKSSLLRCRTITPQVSSELLMGEAFSWFPSTQGRRNGRACAPNKNKRNVKPQGNAAPERQTTKTFQKLPVQKKRIFRPVETNGRADGSQTKAFPNSVLKVVRLYKAGTLYSMWCA